MDTKTITTPNNYLVTIKSDLTYGEYEDIQAIIGESIEINPDSGKPKTIDFKLLRTMNQKALDILLVKIEKDGQLFTGKFTDLPSKDGKVIMKEIDCILKDISPDEEEDKKKETA